MYHDIAINKQCQRRIRSPLFPFFFYCLRTNVLWVFWRKTTTFIAPLTEYQLSVVKITSQAWISSWEFLFEKPHTPGQVMAFIDHLWQVVCSFEDQEQLTAQEIQPLPRADPKPTDEAGGVTSASMALEINLKGEDRTFSGATSSRRSGSELTHISESTPESTESILLHSLLQAASAFLNANSSITKSLPGQRPEAMRKP